MPTDKYDYSNREAIAVAAIKDAIPPEMKEDMLAESKGGFVELFRSDVIPNHYITTAIYYHSHRWRRIEGRPRLGHGHI